MVPFALEEAFCPMLAIGTFGRNALLRGLNETVNYELPIPLETTPQPTIKIRKRDRERAERIRLAAGPKPSLRERAVALAREKGEVRTCDLTDIGVPAVIWPECATRACSLGSATASIAPPIRRWHDPILANSRRMAMSAAVRSREWKLWREIGDTAMRSMSVQ